MEDFIFVSEKKTGCAVLIRKIDVKYVKSISPASWDYGTEIYLLQHGRRKLKKIVVFESFAEIKFLLNKKRR